MKLNLEAKIIGPVVATFLIGALCIGFFGIIFVRNDVRDIVDTYSNTAIGFIKYAIEETMATGNTEITKDLLKRKRSEQNIESIVIFNAEGQEAFSSDKTKAQIGDMAIINNIKKTKNAFTQENADSIIYYAPFIAANRCIKCHEEHDKVLGVMKVSVLVKDAKLMVRSRQRIIIIGLFFATLLFGTAIWLIFKRTVMNPIKKLEDFSKALSIGDFTFKTGIKSKDEFGLLNEQLKESTNNISTIIHRAAKVAERVGRVSSEVESESKSVIGGTHLEASVSQGIYASMDEFDKSIGEIAE
ncbi:MAG: methyl-accepting chemotaxis protein, partial [Nitrospirota bacterium]